MANDKTKSVAPHAKPRSEVESLQAALLQVAGQGDAYRPTESQVDKILALREKGMDYTYKENTQISPRLKAQIGIFVFVVVVLLIILAGVLYFAKDYFGEVLSGIIGLLTGGLGGYGLASSKRGEDS